MRFTKFGVMAAACAMMASCASDEPASKGNENAIDNGYASITINLPTTKNSRAVSYEDGEATEYAVANGKVYVFKKATSGKEGDATFVCSAPLTGMTFSKENINEVTTTSRAVAKVTGISMADESQYGILVLLNVPNEGSDDRDGLVSPTDGQTLSSWVSTVQTPSTNMIFKRNNINYIMMSSAAKYVENGEPTLLVDFNKTTLKASEAEALAAEPAATVYVQRNVAKVSVTTAADGKYTVAGEGTTYAGDEVTVTAWGLDITNKTTYAFQNVAGLSTDFDDIWSTNRFFGGSTFARVFWAKDPNYNATIDTQDKVKAAFNLVTDVITKPACAYALENTFDINHQLQGQTTRVVIKATYKPHGFAAAANFYKLGSAVDLWSDATLEAEILARAQTIANKTDGISVNINAIKTKGYHSLNEVTITGLDDNQKARLALQLGLSSVTAEEIACYANGESYYVVRVRHFDNDETPWNLGQATYDSDNEKWLGRYGMVRNNWYEVNLQSFSRPGTPTVPEIKIDTPDDESEFYLTCSINILAWAKRTQNENL